MCVKSLFGTTYCIKRFLVILRDRIIIITVFIKATPYLISIDTP
jgi:hypothetical protein